MSDDVMTVGMNVAEPCSSVPCHALSDRSSHSLAAQQAPAIELAWFAGGAITSAVQHNGNPGGKPSGDAPARQRGGTAGGRTTTLINLTYVSECRIPPTDLTAEIDAIRAIAEQRNQENEITGALLFTGTRFVQTLEGEIGRVDGLLAAIGRDQRHARLATVDRHAVTARNFARWSLSYAGPSLFIAQTVARGVDGFSLGNPCDVARLVRLMIEFGTAPKIIQARR